MILRVRDYQKKFNHPFEFPIFVHGKRQSRCHLSREETFISTSKEPIIERYVSIDFKYCCRVYC